MKKHFLRIALLWFVSAGYLTAQTIPTSDTGLATESEPEIDSSPVFTIPPALVPAERNISWKRLLPEVASDQARIWSFPARAFRRKNLLPELGFLGGTAALIALDATSARSVRNSTAFGGFNSIFSGNNTALATLLVPASFYGFGLMRGNSYLQQTALLAGVAILDSEIVTTAMKDLDRRLRPADVANKTGFSDTWFDGKLTSLGGNGSFPSGHTIAAFSVATVIAHRYRSHRWVPYAAYGAAALIGFSRVSLMSHFPSDVFAGAGLGYAITRFVVLRPHEIP